MSKFVSTRINWIISDFDRRAAQRNRCGVGTPGYRRQHRPRRPAGEVNEITVMLGSGGSRSISSRFRSKYRRYDRIVGRSGFGGLQKEQLPAFYFRINGLNTINLSVTPEKIRQHDRSVQTGQGADGTIGTNFP